MIENFAIGYFLIDLAFVSILVFGIYGREKGNDEFAFTYLIFNIVTYLLSYYLITMILILGEDIGAEAFLLGLFALFGMLRYRTDPIPVYNLTFLFISIGLGLVNSVMQTAVGYSEILLINLIIVGFAALANHFTHHSQDRLIKMTYDDIEKILGPEIELIDDIAKRTGLDIESIHINRIDLLRDTAQLHVIIRK
tara:strand:+ start:97 stop:681 length:585 start_codon:yes stop_codon:yes gene_type:complete